MKELKNFKQVKKKPGQFKKQQKKHQNIQHNRDQLKLLKEGKIEQAELFILDPDCFKKVTIKSLPIELISDWFGHLNVVYLSHNGKNSKLRTTTIVSKDAGGRCKTLDEGFIEWKHCFGVIVKEEILKDKTKE